ncbi:MAG: YebC/PmpR family DNA-binding transcriptional regulator [Gemmatimonadetes bacterium]|nr:YebC/PmpR family DNA-binding transcriptional regulator [Gemmatimonadota bacterium]
MSGHSKWSKIKRKKAIADKSRGRLFSKLGREITVAARDGGGDPSFNPRLRTAVDNAKAQRMPNENIDRAIKRGTGDLPGAAFEEITYEGYAPGGAALYLECLTDNPRRTLAQVRHLLDKRGGNLGQNGCVAWMFERKGQVILDAGTCDSGAALEAALEAGAEDFDDEDGTYIVTAEPSAFHAVVESLKTQGVPISGAELAMVARSGIELEGEEGRKVAAIISALEDHDDVQKVWTNAEIEEAAWEALEE